MPLLKAGGAFGSELQEWSREIGSLGTVSRMDKDLFSALRSRGRALRASFAGVVPASLNSIGLLSQTPRLCLPGQGSGHQVPPLHIQMTVSTHSTWLGPSPSVVLP